MADLLLRCASQNYDHTRPLYDGRVRIPGVEMQHLDLFPPDTLRRMVGEREFETSDMGLNFYLSALDRGDRSFVAIPVFPARGFRHSAIYVRTDGSVREPRDLTGKRVGEFNLYGTDTGIWVKGILSDEYGIRHDAYRYRIGGIGKPYPPAEWTPMKPPPGVEIEHIGDRTLDDLLENGEIDAIFSPHAPAGMRKRPATARRLFENFVEVEQAWYAKNRIYATTQVFIIRRDVYEENRWLARALYDGLKEAKKLAMDRYKPPARGSVMPWLASHTQRVIDLMGADWWPYGIEANRNSLETFARYHHEQGLLKPPNQGRRIVRAGSRGLTRCGEKKVREHIRAAAVIAALMVTLPTIGRAAKLVRVGKSSDISFTFVPIEMGIEQGIFQRNGIQLETSVFGGTSKIQQAMIAGSLDLALAGGTDVPFIMKGAPEIGVAAIAVTPALFGVTVRYDDPIHSLADLKGKTVGVSTVGLVSQWFALQIVKTQGWQRDDLKIVAIGGGGAENTAALKARNVDAVLTAAALGWELEQHKEGRLLAPASDFVDAFLLNVMYATNDFAEKHPDVLGRFLKAWFETVDYMASHKAETVKLAQTITHFSAEVQDKQYDVVMPSMSRDGTYPKEALDVVAQSFVDLELLLEKPDMNKYLTTRYLSHR